MAQIMMDGIDYQGDELSADELRVFNQHFDRYLAPLYSEVDLVTSAPADGSDPSTMERRRLIPEGAIARMIQQRKDHVRMSIMVAKRMVGGTFKGIDGRGTEVVFGPIRPWHILRSAATAAETCSIAWGAISGTGGGAIAAWATGNTLSGGASDYWIGYSTNNTTPINIDKRLLMLVMGYSSIGPDHVVESVQLTVDSTTYQPTTIDIPLSLAPSDYRVSYVAAKSQIISPRAQVLGTVATSAAQIDTLQVIGVSTGQAALMIQQYTAAPTL